MREFFFPARCIWKAVNLTKQNQNKEDTDQTGYTLIVFVVKCVFSRTGPLCLLGRLLFREQILVVRNFISRIYFTGLKLSIT